uniref:Type I neck protein n=1 Tax=Siphoviridae sp. ctnNB1 TaxID=2825660 RepID=A0A8S5UV43_9CAUD|nr:MAG TPA: type I neck protein [Siphoviridae sp. ctnNB1]
MAFSIKANGSIVNISGIEELENELQRLNSVRLEAVQKKQLTQMLNRARSVFTPIDTGELRKSSAVNKEEMGYMKEYAPHVEYGHRTKNGGFVQGQYFLKKNVDIQRGIYFDDLLNAIEKG